MKQMRAVVLIAALALALIGCDQTSSSNTAGPTAPGVVAIATSEPQATSAPIVPTVDVATALSTAVGSTMPVTPTGEIQDEQITIDASGLLEPSTISTTVGVSLSLELINRNADDALLVFDLSPAGAFAVLAPGTGQISGTTTPISATSVPTATAESANVTATAATAESAETTSTPATTTASPVPTSQLLLVPTGSPTSITGEANAATGTAEPTSTATARAATATVATTAATSPATTSATE
ncbi:MAG TPA: hypothetical protein VFX76_04185, partial [Roseiflexaceae bacterium]|nr:hypothetical protein [Roseiflexaceae bacterium]